MAVIGFGSLADAKRVIKAVRIVESNQRSERPVRSRSLPADPVQLVEVLGGPDGGLYPARIVSWDESLADYHDLGDVQFRNANSSSVAPGTYLLARYSGLVPDEGASVYVGAFSCCGGSDPDVTDPSDPWFCVNMEGAQFGCRQFADSATAEALGWTVLSGPHSTQSECNDTRCVSPVFTCGSIDFVDPGDTVCLTMTGVFYGGQEFTVTMPMNVFHEGISGNRGAYGKSWGATFFLPTCQAQIDNPRPASVGGGANNLSDVQLVYNDGCWGLNFTRANSIMHANGTVTRWNQPPQVYTILNQAASFDPLSITFDIVGLVNDWYWCIQSAHVTIDTTSPCVSESDPPVPGSGGWYCSHRGTADSFDCRSFVSQAEAESLGYTVVAGPFDDETACISNGCEPIDGPIASLNQGLQSEDCATSFFGPTGAALGLMPTSYTLDFGDGDTTSGVIYSDTPAGNPLAYMGGVYHGYDGEGGPYTAGLTLTDSLGRTDTANLVISCGELPEGESCPSAYSLLFGSAELRADPCPLAGSLWYKHTATYTGTFTFYASYHEPEDPISMSIEYHSSCVSGVVSSGTGTLTIAATEGQELWFKVTEPGLAGEAGDAVVFIEDVTWP